MQWFTRLVPGVHQVSPSGIRASRKGLEKGCYTSRESSRRNDPSFSPFLTCSCSRIHFGITVFP